MDLTTVQRRTLADLIDVGTGREFRPDLAVRLRESLEGAIAPSLPLPQRPLLVERPLRLWKERLNSADRCQGLLEADLLGERAPFEHNEASAAGTLAHRCIELEVALAQEAPPAEVADQAAGRLQRDRRFAPYWSGLDGAERADLLMRAVRSLEHFRASFPPIRALRRELAPVTELWMEAFLAERSVVLKGKVDLLLNASRGQRSTRLLVDLKGGRARTEHAEDMRLYALIHTLRWGVPPFRVATFFLASGEWQAEDVTEEVLEHAAERVVDTVRLCARLAGGAGPALTGGPHCLGCPRRAACPSSALGGGGASEGERGASGGGAFAAGR